LSAIQAMVLQQQRLGATTSSPRSDSAISKLNSIEEAISTLESEMFSLVPLISKPDTKSKLAKLTIKCEDLQAKQVDAVQSVGLSSQIVVVARRRSLVKRLDILSNLGSTLHGIAGDKTLK